MKACEGSEAPGYTAVLSSWTEVDGGRWPGCQVPWTSSKQLPSVASVGVGSIRRSRSCPRAVCRAGPGTLGRHWPAAGGWGRVCRARPRDLKLRRGGREAGPARGEVTTPAPPGVVTLTSGAQTPALGSWRAAARAARGEGRAAAGRGDWVACG